MTYTEPTDELKIDFLCIGAQRSGTTWLSNNLNAHPDFWVPPFKEIHYFSRFQKYESPSFLECKSLIEKLTAKTNEANTWRRLFVDLCRRWIYSTPLKQKYPHFFWYYHFLFKKPGDVWYHKLFRPGLEKIKGELTPAYSLLDENDIKIISQLFPDLKVILIMRDPVERVLSQLRYHIDGKAWPFIDYANKKQLLDFAVANGQIRRGNYPLTLKNWSRHFSSKNIFTIFYDEIQKNPTRSFFDIITFLGAKSKIYDTKNQTTEYYNQSNSRMFQSDFIKAVVQAHESVLRECSETLGETAKQWITRWSLK